MKEIWTDIKDYEGIYQISNMGRVKNIKYNRFLKTSITRGYQTVVLSKNNKQKSYLVHRLVMKNFYPIDNMDNLQVNHKDENKLNNCLSNLEWMTRKENVNYGTGIQRRVETQRLHNPRSKPIRCVETGEEFISIRECERITKIDKASLNRCLHKRQHTAGGYHWEYIN